MRDRYLNQPDLNSSQNQLNKKQMVGALVVSSGLEFKPPVVYR